MGARGALRKSSMALGLVLALSSGCAGRSERSGDAADEADGGTAGTDTGSGGSSQGGDVGSGGAEPAGGTSDGGTIPIPSGGVNAGGTGGTGIVVGGAGGTAGGTQVCPTCPEADYGLVIEGDGATYDIDYNGTIDGAADRAPTTCPEQPITGVISACTRSIMFSACEDPMSGPPCLEVTGGTARYVDHRTGKLWTGFVTADVPAAAGVVGVASGTLTLSFTDASGEMLVLTVRYTICAPLGNLRIPCAPP